jgi:uncharacterized SAM-dependent methyltransferase
MKYFRNTELAKLYNVSEKSVRNWIDSARAGKIDLQLLQVKDKFYIANTTQNGLLVADLAQRGKKYKNSRGYKVVTPSPKFYELFTSKEIFNITSNLDVYHEAPLQYSYFDGGAKNWDGYVKKLATEQAPNILSNTKSLLEMNADYLDNVLDGCDYINIIDIGPGNCYPVEDFLERFIKSGRLNRYIALDISPDMLKIAESNIHRWFGEDASFEGYTRDISFERFGDLIARDSFGKDVVVRNIVLFLGSTLSNFRDALQPLATIHESMGKNDLFIFSRQLDTANARRYFDFEVDENNASKVSPMDKFTLELLGIDESMYEVEQFFDEEHMARRIQVRLKISLSIEFQLDNKAKVITFNKDDTLLLWQHNHQNAQQTLDTFNAHGFELLQATVSKDDECLLTVHKLMKPRPTV